MESRRKFLKTSAAAMAVAATKPLFGIQGANDRIRMAVIGCGNRSGRVFDAFARQSNVQWMAGAEVNKARSEERRVGKEGKSRRRAAAWSKGEQHGVATYSLQSTTAS